MDYVLWENLTLSVAWQSNQYIKSNYGSQITISDKSSISLSVGKINRQIACVKYSLVLVIGHYTKAANDAASV